MKRLCVFAHHDIRSKVDDYVFYYLNALNLIADDIVFVTTTHLSKDTLSSLTTICSNIICRENIGYDFMSYKVGLDSCNLDTYDEVLICNDSVYGPLYPLKSLFGSMAHTNCDFWGITDSNQFAHHLQSYFILFRRKAISSKAFKNFWGNVKILEEKNDIIFQYEIGLSDTLTKAGLNFASLIKSDTNHTQIYLKIAQIALNGNLKIAWAEIQNFRPFKPVNCNITLWFWDDIVTKKKMPFIKTAALRDNSLKHKSAQIFNQTISKVSKYPSILIHQHLNSLRSIK